MALREEAWPRLGECSREGRKPARISQEEQRYPPGSSRMFQAEGTMCTKAPEWLKEPQQPSLAERASRDGVGGSQEQVERCQGAIHGGREAGTDPGHAGCRGVPEGTPPPPARTSRDCQWPPLTDGEAEAQRW